MKPIRKIQGEQETGNPDRIGASRKQETGEFFVRLKFNVYSLKLNSFKFAGGQSLIEVLIAFTVSVVIGMALVSAGLATQRASISARNKSQATKLAQEYLEEIRLIRDVKGFSSFMQYGCWKIKTTDSGGVESTDPSVWTLAMLALSACHSTISQMTNADKSTLNNTVFYRELKLTSLVPSSSTKVSVQVYWQEGVNTRSVFAETVLSKWCEGAVTGTPVTGVCP